MALNPPTNTNAFRQMFEREKLNGSNFNDWFQVIDEQTPVVPGANAST